LAAFGLLLALQSCRHPKSASEAFLDDYESHNFLPFSDRGGASLIAFLRSEGAPQGLSLSALADEMARRASSSSWNNSERENYFIVLKTQALEPQLSTASLGALSDCFKDPSEDIYFRLLSASVLSKSSARDTPELSTQLIDVAEGAVRRGAYPATALKMVLENYYLADANVRGFVQSLLSQNGKAESDKLAKDSALVVIEKLDDSTQIDAIEALVRDPVLAGTYTPARALNALAAIGGEEAFQFFKATPLSSNYQDRVDLLLAMGISRANGAGDFLLDDLRRYGDSGEFVADLQALAYLGDAKTLPGLRAYAASHSLNEERASLFSSTVATIEGGGKAAPGMESEWSGE
jgi:hypothetical protein